MVQSVQSSHKRYHQVSEIYLPNKYNDHSQLLLTHYLDWNNTNIALLFYQYISNVYVYLQHIP